MRLAVCGAHRTGKTTLVEALARALPGHRVVDEPYRLLEDEGHAFADPPSLEDFERQLERSIVSLEEADGPAIFDRCPADFLAYLLTHRERAAFDLDRWLPPARQAMGRLHLLVFVPVERPDRVEVGADERAWRRRVDEALRGLVLQDRWDLGVETVEVSGDVAARARQVLAR